MNDTLVAQLARADMERIKNYKGLLDFYYGRQWEGKGRRNERRQFRWNKASGDFSVKDIITAVLGRVGLKLAVISQSAAVGGFCPDFTINPGNTGGDVIRKLLSFVPDEILIEGSTVYLVNPQADDNSVYSYGIDHAIMEGKYLRNAMKVNSMQVEGWDTGAGRAVIVESFSWDEMENHEERPKHVIDRNLNTAVEAEQRGDALLRRAETEVAEGFITVPVNCGQQLFDVVAVTDAQAGLNAVKKRVKDITLVYNPAGGEYFQRLGLGRV